MPILAVNALAVNVLAVNRPLSLYSVKKYPLHSRSHQKVVYSPYIASYTRSPCFLGLGEHALAGWPWVAVIRDFFRKASQFE